MQVMKAAASRTRVVLRKLMPDFAWISPSWGRLWAISTNTVIRVIWSSDSGSMAMAAMHP